MRQLFPLPDDDVDPAARYAGDSRPAPASRPWVVANMVSSVDGATDVDGVSGGLGGPADKEVFAALRSLSDVVLVAAGTVRAEHYGPIRLAAPLQARRVERGQAPLPRLAIVTARLDLDLTTPLFTDSEQRPVIFTIERAAPDRRAAAAEVADVVTLGDDSVDLTAALAWARREAGASVVLTEGGPSLIGALAAADAIDELCWTVAPTIVGGDSSRLARGPLVRPPLALHLDRILEADGTLFLRYSRAEMAGG